MCKVVRRYGGRNLARLGVALLWLCSGSLNSGAPDRPAKRCITLRLVPHQTSPSRELFYSASSLLPPQTSTALDHVVVDFNLDLRISIHHPYAGLEGIALTLVFLVTAPPSPPSLDSTALSDLDCLDDIADIRL